MGAGYGGTGVSITYQESASFTQSGGPGAVSEPSQGAAAITTTRPWVAQTTAEDKPANNDCRR